MPVDFINISSIWPSGTDPLGVNGSLNLVGSSPQYLVNGFPMGMVSTISPGGLSGAVTLSAGANMSITQSGQTITFASTGGGGGGSSQWIDVVGPGGGIYYGGHVGILTTDPQVALAVNGYMRVSAMSPWPPGGDGLDLFFNPTSKVAFVNSYNATSGAFYRLDFNGDPVTINANWSFANVGIGTATPTLGSLQIARSDGNFQLIIERSGPNDPQIYGLGIYGAPGNPSLYLTDVTRSAPRMILAPTGEVSMLGGAKVGVAAFNHAPGDLGVSRNGEPTAGVVYLGSSGSSYLYFDGVGFTLQGGNLSVTQGVGIGVNPPVAQLHVVGNALVQSGSLEIQNTPNPTLTFHYPFVSIIQLISYGDRLSTMLGGFEALTVNISGNVGIGTNSPTSRFHVSNGRSSFQNQAEPYCIALWGSNTASPTYVGTDMWGNMTIHDAMGTVRCMLTQTGTMVVSNPTPFDPGNPHLQVVAGLCVNNMADNGFATIRMVSADQAWGAFWHYPNSVLSFGVTNPWDCYGWAAAWPMSVDCSTGAVSLSSTTINGNLGVTGNAQVNGTVNAGAFTVNGQPLQSMGGGWSSYPVVVTRISDNYQFPLVWANGFYKTWPYLTTTAMQVQISFLNGGAGGGGAVRISLPFGVQATGGSGQTNWVGYLRGGSGIAGQVSTWVSDISAGTGPIITLNQGMTADMNYTIIGSFTLQ